MVSHVVGEGNVLSKRVYFLLLDAIWSLNITFLFRKNCSSCYDIEGCSVPVVIPVTFRKVSGGCESKIEVAHGRSKVCKHNKSVVLLNPTCSDHC